MQIKKNYRTWLILCTAVILSGVALAQQKAKTYRKIPLLQLQDTAFRCTIIGKEVYLGGDIYLGDTTVLTSLIAVNYSGTFIRKPLIIFF